jgi:hypothetical protein
MRIVMVVLSERAVGDRTDAVSAWCADHGIEPEVHEVHVDSNLDTCAIVHQFERRFVHISEDDFPLVILENGNLASLLCTPSTAMLKNYWEKIHGTLTGEQEAELAEEAAWASGGDTGE